MLKCIDRIKNNIHLYENGKNSVIAAKPECFLDFLQALIEMKPAPKNMQNKDPFRNVNQKDIATIVRAAINNRYYDQNYRFKKYNEETPKNRVFLWGIAFNSLLDTFVELATPGEKRTYIVKNYNDVPTRYRSAVRKQDNKYVITYKVAKTSLMFENADAQRQFNAMIEEARNLIPSVYKAFPSALSNRKQNMVSDEQIIAIKRLREIFENIIPLVVFTTTKSNTYDTISEYIKTQNKQNVFLKAQRHMRTASQVVVSAKKNADLFDKYYISETEERYKQIRKTVFKKLKSEKYCICK